MAQTMIDLMTDEQIDDLVDTFRVALCKYRSEFEFNGVKQSLGIATLGMELLLPLRKHVEAGVNNRVIRNVKVDRTRAGLRK